MLLLFPKLINFWNKVEIDSCSSYLEEIKECKVKMCHFYDHISSWVFTNTVLGDGENFYFHATKN